MRIRWECVVVALSLCLGLLADAAPAADTGNAPVAGSGRKVPQVGDDFEDEKWEYYPNLPKSSHNIDDQIRVPGGIAKNERFFEAALRGQPDLIKRVPTPPGGLPESQGSLLLATMHSGVPGAPSYAPQQDDLIANVRTKLGGYLPPAITPSVVCRVHVPPFDKWEQRWGASFGFRLGLRAGHFKEGQREEYWPGFFIHRVQVTEEGQAKTAARLVIRSDQWGRDLNGPLITEPGWWTLGMTVTPDGRVHYFGHAGVENLTPQDHLASQYPYGYRCHLVETFFFNVISADNGRTWSTPWIVDDAEVFVIDKHAVQTAAKPVTPEEQPR